MGGDVRASRGWRRWAWVGLIGTLLAVGAWLLWPPGSPEAPGERPAPPPEGFSDLPKIDVHTHVGLQESEEALEIMAENGINLALNASGGAPGAGLERSATLRQTTGGRLQPYCNVPLNGVEEPGFADEAKHALAACRDLEAVGLKIFKSLGLGITLSDGSLLAVDDARLDPLFEHAGALGLPVLIHSGDPQAFFRPPGLDNERHEELAAHPSWSFHGEREPGQAPWPSWETVFAQYERRVARHPGTTFVGAHFGNVPEEPRRVARMLERYPNLVVETGARIPEIGRHPAAEMRRFFERFQDRVLFGTDLAVTTSGLTLGSRGRDPDPRDRVPEFFQAHFRYFETQGRGLAHPTPIQGRWTIDGVGLPRSILEKIYWRNAARVFHLTLPSASDPPPGGDGP